MTAMDERRARGLAAREAEFEPRGPARVGGRERGVIVVSGHGVGGETLGQTAIIARTPSASMFAPCPPATISPRLITQ